MLTSQELLDDLRTLAMEEMRVVQMPVGTSDQSSSVEFFALDLKKDKVALTKLRKIIGRHWRKVLNDFELAKDDASDVLADTLNGPVGALASWLELRRFLSNAVNPEMMKKTKRAVLLFHHDRANAPELSNELRAA